MSDVLASALASSSLTVTFVAVLSYLGRTWLGERLRASLRLETETALTELQSELGAAAEKLRFVSDAGLAATAHLNAAMAAARVEAVRQLWAAMLEWRKLSAVVTLALVANDEYLRKHGSDPATVDTFKQLLAASKYLDILNAANRAEVIRPFLREDVWANYSTIHACNMLYITRAAVLSMGKAKDALPVDPHVRKLIEATAPHLLSEFDQQPFTAVPKFLAALEVRLLGSVRDMLSGDEIAPAAAEKAASLAALAAALVKKDEASSAPSKLPGK